MYHWEADQEDFLVLAGEALLIVEGEGPARTVGSRALPCRHKARDRQSGHAACVVLAVGPRSLHRPGLGRLQR